MGDAIGADIVGRRGQYCRIDWPDGSSCGGVFLDQELRGPAPGGRLFARVVRDDSPIGSDPDDDVVRVPIGWLTFRATRRPPEPGMYMPGSPPSTGATP